ncbi:hypothetical protein TcWFU_007174 [Taenia crassiceps]|uniref:Uncharacterized protein n=1 Tax=Taenia crassiceps TaxID=6207 RepID=A0ABR4QML0_9CEST
MAIALDEGMYSALELPGGFFMGEMDPFQQDFGEDDDIDDQNGWMVVNEGEITQLLNQIEEAEQREDEEEMKGENHNSQRIDEAYESIATEKSAVETADERRDIGEIEHTPTTVTMASSKSADFWTTNSVVKKIPENDAVKKPANTEAATDSTTAASTTSGIPSTTATALGEATTASLRHAETTLSSTDDFDALTSEAE